MNNLLEFNLQELTEYIKKFGHKPYRAKQLLRWIYYFNEDHFEHIDYLSHNQEVISFLIKEKVKGEVQFGCLDGDQFGKFWGYKFDGSGNFKETKGSLSWK